MKISIIGAGKVATQLATALFKADNCISDVFSRTINSAEQLAKKVDAPFTDTISEITTGADVYLIAVSDSALENVIDQLKNQVGKSLVAHTAGSMSMDIFKSKVENYGVFYPLQTFSKTRSARFEEIPLCIEANNQLSFNVLNNLATTLSNDVREINSTQRKQIHLAAVFVCNFTNFMYHAGQELLDKQHISFDILRPLIQETADKVMQEMPENTQTGPAVRYDKNVIEKHLQMLSDNPQLQDIYQTLSKGIYQKHKKKE